MGAMAEQAAGAPQVVERRTQRALPAAAGAAFAVLVLVGNGIYTGGGGQTLGFTVEMLGYVALAGFIAWAVATLRGAVEWAAMLALFGGATMIAIKLGGWAAVHAANQAATAPEVAAGLVALDESAWVLAWLPYGLFIAGLSVAALRARRLPRPVAWLGVVLGLSCMAAVPISTSEPFPLPWMISLVWLIVASIILVLRGGPRGDKTWSVEV